MADRYWVGGTATWDATAGTKWSTTSGGAGGASVPGTADNVFFDSNSGSGTVTVSGSRTCLSFNATGFTGTLAGTATPNLQVYGNLTFGSGMTVDNTLSTVTFLGVGSFTITSNGKSFVAVTFNNAGDTWTLQDALTATGTVTLTAGIIDLGSYTLTCAAVSSSNSNARSIAFGTGKIVLTGSGTVWNFATSTSFTSTGTNKIVEATLSAAQTITPGTPTEANAVDFVIPNTAGNFTLTLTGSDTYRSLTFGNATYTVSNTAITIYGNLTIEGTSPTFTSGINTWTFAAGGSVVQQITTNGKTINFPLFKGNSTTSSLQLQDDLTFVTGGKLTLQYGILDLQSYTLTTVDFTSSYSTGRTIAFGTGKIVISPNGQWATSTGTNLVTTGSKLVEAVINTSQTTVIDCGSITEANVVNISVVQTGAGTANISGNVGSLTFPDSAYTVSNNALNVYGDLTIAGPTPTFTAGTNTWTFAATGSTVQNITTNGATLNFPVTKGGVATSTLRLQDNLSLELTKTFTLTLGVLDLQSFTLSPGLFNSNNTNIRSIEFGTGKILLSGTATATSWNTTNGSILTTNGSKLVEVTAPIGGQTKTLALGTITEANALDVSVISGGGTGSVAISGNVRNLSFANDSYTVSNTTIVIYGNLLVSGTSPTFTSGTATYSLIATSGTQTITTNGNTLSFPISVGVVGVTIQIEDSLTLASNRTFTFNAGTLNLQSYTLTTGIFASSNSNVRTLNFGTGKIVLTDTSSTSLSMGTSTNFASSGTRLIEGVTGGSSRTYAFGTGVTEANTLNFSITPGGTTGGTFAISGRINNFNADNVTCSVNTVGAATIYGDFFISATSTITWSAGGSTTFAATSGTKSITTNGVTINSDLTFNGIGGAWQLQDALTINVTYRTTLTAGAVDLNDYTLSTGSFYMTQTGVKSLDFGSAEIFITEGSGYPTATAISITSGGYTNYSVSGLNRFALNSPSRDISISILGATDSRMPSVRVVSVSGLLTGGISINDFILSGSGQIRPVAQTNYEIQIYGNLLIEATWTGSFGATGDPSFNPPYFYNILLFKSTSGTKTITSNGKISDAIIEFDSATGSWRFEDSYTQTSQSDPDNFERYMELVNGSVDFNGYTITVNSFQRRGSSPATLTFNGATLSILGTDYTYSGSNYNPVFLNTDGLTITDNTGEIAFLTTSSRTTFAGGGNGVYGDVVVPPIRCNGTGGVLIAKTGSKLTLANLLPRLIASSYFYFQNGITYNFQNFTLTPPSPHRGYLISNGGPGTPYYFVLNSGIANCQRLNIEDSQASPTTNTWYAGSTSVNVSGNTGWIFADAPQASGNMLMLFA